MGPQASFRCKSIFRHDDRISEVSESYLWMVGQVGKIDEILFLEYWAKLFIDRQSKNRCMSIIISS